MRIPLPEKLIRMVRRIRLDCNNVLPYMLGTDVQEILDVGCGHGKKITVIKENPFHVKIGIDIYPPCIRYCKKIGTHDSYILSSAVDLPFRMKTFDAVLFLDILEHLSKPEGREVLRYLEELARKQIVLFTTVGYVPQKAFDGNIFQVHKSGWMPQELKNLGYRIRGLNGVYSLRGDRAKFRYTGIFRYIAEIASILTGPITYLFPSYAFQMLCVKN